MVADENGVGKESTEVDETDETRKAKVARTPKGPQPKRLKITYHFMPITEVGANGAFLGKVCPTTINLEM